MSITLDRYGHLIPGNEAEAAVLLDASLDARDGVTRPSLPADNVASVSPRGDGDATKEDHGGS